MSNPLALELMRQIMRWIGLVALNVPWVPTWVINLTSNEEFIIWVTGLALYALSDSAWSVSFYKRVRAAMRDARTRMWRRP